MAIERKSRVAGLIAGLAVAAGVLLMCWPGTGLGPAERRAAGLVVAAIGLLATAVIPEVLTALMLFAAAMLLNAAPAGVVFSGFESTAVWLVFSGLILGAAITSTGLGRRIAGGLANHLQGGYTRIVAGVTLLGTAFAFIMPSAMGRVALLVPITAALSGHFGFKEGSNGRTGLILAATLGTFIPAFSILPANVPNMILAGMAERQLDAPLLYGEYLALHFPVLGLLKAVLIVAVIVRLYPDRPVLVDRRPGAGPEPMQRPEKRLTLVLAVLLVLWLTDFLHHVSPAWIALAGAVLLLLPRVGVVGAGQFNTKINFGSVFFVAGVVGLGSIIHHSGLGVLVGKGLLAVLPLRPEAPFASYLSIATASALTGLVTTQPGVPAVTVPLAAEISAASGLPLKTVLMIQVAGFSTVFLPYQAPPLVVALQMSGESTRGMLKPLLLLAAVTMAALVPLNYLWWGVLGRLHGG